jgi:predicted dehydrogenase
MPKTGLNRRNFVRTTVGAGALASMPAQAAASPQRSTAGQPAGANDRINIGMIGVGGRGSSVMRLVLSMAEGAVTPPGPRFRRGRRQQQPSNPRPIKVTAVCDVYEKRKRLAQEQSKAEFATLDYREVLARSDVDVVIIATPDHWHAPIAMAALDAGKDVYLEKPMTHTIAEAKALARKVKETGRVLQVGSQTTSSDQWWKARKAIQDGMIGDLISSQGSYHRNSLRGEWNQNIEPEAGPGGKGVDYIDWKMWLGNTPEREFDPQRYFRYRKYWDYSGGVATDLFYHVVAPLQICWGEAQFPYRVTTGGGIYAFPDREVPDTFNLLADFAKGHSLVLSSSMANSTHIPGLIRGRKGTITIVEHGRFEGETPYITATAESIHQEEFVQKFGYSSVQIPVKPRQVDGHMANFLDCVRSRKKPNLDVDTGYRAQVTISMAVQSFREGKVLYFDPKKEEVVYEPPELG